LPERITSDLHSVSVQGSRVVYGDRGDGPVLLLVHGMFGDHLDWEPVLVPLAARHRVLAVDLPGFGGSDKPDANYSTEFFLAALAEFLDRIAVRRATLAGNSFGGILATRFALAHADRVERLILVSGVREFNEEERNFTRARMSRENLLGLTPEVNQLMFAPIFAKEGPAQERYLAKQNAKLLRADYPEYARAMARSVETALTAYQPERLGEMRCPVLLLWGQQDVVIPPDHARHALAQLKNGTLVVLPGCGHAPQLDDPEAFVAAIEEFFRKSEPYSCCLNPEEG
jgi:pimeloyl-ACP methyl ester carboxylesterase